MRVGARGEGWGLEHGAHTEEVDDSRLCERSTPPPEARPVEETTPCTPPSPCGHEGSSPPPKPPPSPPPKPPPKPPPSPLPSPPKPLPSPPRPWPSCPACCEDSPRRLASEAEVRPVACCERMALRRWCW